MDVMDYITIELLKGFSEMMETMEHNLLVWALWLVAFLWALGQVITACAKWK